VPHPRPRLSAADEADLAALADGRLEPARRAAVQARVDADPVLAAALAEQRAAVRALAVVSEQVSAPPALRARVAELQRAAARPSRRAAWAQRRRAGGSQDGRAADDDARGSRDGPAVGGDARRARVLRPGRLLPAGGLVAAAVVVLFLALGGEPTVQSALAAASRPPQAAARTDPARPKLLREQVDGVRFPDYGAKFGWRAAGVRSDDLDGRTMRTVFYERAGQRVAYSIVSGDALDQPGGARRFSREGVALRGFSGDGRNAVTWRRGGHTCVLSGIGVGTDALLQLAAWHGLGAIPF
jgi:anti-sigma factor RsiW